jgi:hypothetical protein
LKNFGKDAKMAGPALLDLARDAKRSAGLKNGLKLPPGVTVHTPTIGEMTTNALWEVDPALARKAGMAYPW